MCVDYGEVQAAVASMGKAPGRPIVSIIQSHANGMILYISRQLCQSQSPCQEPYRPWQMTCIMHEEIAQSPMCPHSGCWVRSAQSNAACNCIWQKVA